MREWQDACNRVAVYCSFLLGFRFSLGPVRSLESSDSMNINPHCRVKKSSKLGRRWLVFQKKQQNCSFKISTGHPNFGTVQPKFGIKNGFGCAPIFPLRQIFKLCLHALTAATAQTQHSVLLSASRGVDRVYIIRGCISIPFRFRHVDKWGQRPRFASQHSHCHCFRDRKK
jgi:hypothetical protein